MIVLRHMKSKTSYYNISLPFRATIFTTVHSFTLTITVKTIFVDIKIVFADREHWVIEFQAFELIRGKESYGKFETFLYVVPIFKILYGVTFLRGPPFLAKMIQPSI